MASIIGKRYSAALFEIAKENEWIDTLEKEIKIVEKVYEEANLAAFLENPKVSPEEKKRIIESSFEGKVKDEIVGLLVLLIRKGRSKYFSDIFEAIQESIDEHEGRIKVYVSSAYKLSADEKTALEDRIARLTKKQVIAIYKVDESLIGGLVIRIGDKVVDSSIKEHLSSMRRSLLAEQAV